MGAARARNAMCESAYTQPRDTDSSRATAVQCTLCACIFLIVTYIMPITSNYIRAILLNMQEVKSWLEDVWPMCLNIHIFIVETAERI
jgi:hypothetical protein